jgi:hypothetical protein
MSPCAGTGVFPELAAGGGVEGDGLVGAGDVHDAVGHHGRDFEAEVVDGKDPFHAERVDVGGIDLLQGAVAVAVQGAVVGEPVTGLRIFDAGEIDPGASAIGAGGCSILCMLLR